MGAVNTTYTFTATDTITSTKMNNIIDQTTITTDAIIGTTLEVATGKLKVRAAGITSNELATGSVTSNAIADDTIVDADINSSAAISLTKLGAGALPSAITVASANIVDGTITASDIANATLTAPKLDGAQTGTAPIYGVRAWAKVNPNPNGVRSSAFKTGNYVRTTTNTTVTMTNHGLKANDKIRLDFTTGSATDGLYTVLSSANANEFVVNHSGAATSGAVTAEFITIQAAGNVSSVSFYDSGSEYMVFNFATPMQNDDYALIGTSHVFPGSWASTFYEFCSPGNTQLNTEYQAFAYIPYGVRFASMMVIG